MGGLDGFDPFASWEDGLKEQKPNPKCDKDKYNCKLRAGYDNIEQDRYKRKNSSNLTEEGLGPHLQ